MLHDQHLEIARGRAVGGDFMKITHNPTGISRSYGPPLGTAKNVHDIKKSLLQQIEEEIAMKGLFQYIWTREEKIN